MERSAPSVATVVLAGGSGTRLGLPDGANKVYLPLAGRPLLSWSLRALYVHLDPVAAVLVVRPGDEALAGAAVGAAGLAERSTGPPRVVPGGATRTESELAGIRALRDVVDGGRVEVVLVHDGARPFPDAAMLRRLVEAAARTGAAVPATPAPSGLVVVGEDQLVAVDPATTRAVQTPQAFRSVELLAATDAAGPGVEAIDTASLVASLGGPVAVVVDGDTENVKVTHAADVARAEALAERRGWPSP